MRAGVLVMVIVCLSDGKDTGCSVGTVTRIKVSKLSKAVVSCPSIVANSSELKYLLFFNDSCISQIRLNKLLESAESLFSSHFEVTAYNSGVYICKREVIYPSPFHVDCHTTEVIVAENQSFSSINNTVLVANQSCPDRPPFILEVVMWAGCGVLLVYSLSITSITIVIWRKMKRDEEDTGVYVNTRRRDLGKPCKF